MLRRLETMSTIPDEREEPHVTIDIEVGDEISQGFEKIKDLEDYVLKVQGMKPYRELGDYESSRNADSDSNSEFDSDDEPATPMRKLTNSPPDFYEEPEIAILKLKRGSTITPEVDISDDIWSTQQIDDWKEIYNIIDKHFEMMKQPTREIEEDEHINFMIWYGAGPTGIRKSQSYHLCSPEWLVSMKKKLLSTMIVIKDLMLPNQKEQHTSNINGEVIRYHSHYSPDCNQWYYNEFKRLIFKCNLFPIISVFLNDGDFNLHEQIRVVIECLKLVFIDTL